MHIFYYFFRFRIAVTTTPTVVNLQLLCPDYNAIWRIVWDAVRDNQHTNHKHHTLYIIYIYTYIYLCCVFLKKGRTAAEKPTLPLFEYKAAYTHSQSPYVCGFLHANLNAWTLKCVLHFFLHTTNIARTNVPTFQLTEHVNPKRRRRREHTDTRICWFGFWHAIRTLSDYVKDDKNVFF